MKHGFKLEVNMFKAKLINNAVVKSIAALLLVALSACDDSNSTAVQEQNPEVQPGYTSSASSRDNFDPEEGLLVDERDGHRYRTVTIGSQIWMAENLNYATSTSRCYENNPNYCETYGRLYLQQEANSACPRGWHVPTEQEASILLKNDASSLLNNGSNTTGFSALLGGSSNGNMGTYAIFWISKTGYDIRISRSSAQVLGAASGEYVSVRCIKDNDSFGSFSSSSFAQFKSSSSFFAFSLQSSSSSQPSSEINTEDFAEQPIVAITNGSISGVAQKGPYLQGSSLRIVSLDGKSLLPSGDTFTDVFYNSNGTYTINGLNLPSQYAMVEASGYYRSEITGNKSNLQMTIGAIIDVRKGANVNIMTDMEYERVKYLVQNEGYNVAGAKKRAFADVLSAFHIENVTGSADSLNITQNGEANGALLAISIMLQGLAGSEFDIRNTIKEFRDDLKMDGVWTDSAVRIKIADIAYEADSARKLIGYRKNIEGWKLSNTVPLFEIYINDFWGTEFGLGKCSANRFGEIKKNQNAASSHKENYFLCDSLWYSTVFGNSGEKSDRNSKKYYRWRNIGQFEYNTRNQVCDVDGLIIPGNIDKDKYYICSGGRWREATNSEVDSYYTECTSDGRLMTLSDGKKYVCDNDELRLATQEEILYNQGCVSYTIGTVVHFKYTDYFDSVISCNRSGYWALSLKQVNPFEYGIDGDIKTIQIGNQVWMAEDYKDIEWPYAHKGSACPTGWKLPSSKDWKELLQYAYKLDIRQVIDSAVSYRKFLRNNVLSKETNFYGFGGTTKGYTLYQCGTSCVHSKSDTTQMFYWGADSLLRAYELEFSSFDKMYSWHFLEADWNEWGSSRQTKEIRIRCLKK